MDVRGIHHALFQIQTEMDIMLAFVIAALYSRRRVGCARGIPSRQNVDVVNSKTICKLTTSSAMIRHDDWHSVDSEGFLKMPS